ncbi:hypothetical protein C2G38_1067211 [Gigaspora rosea]|uniref:Uncharacterized protein n=1 Tax=Gigaspora rosea TaxID=44941 RepID=A0A397VGZ1_9GLOM|nr:hypothetical protein C2G38_1067211 [Gigaspora rosea]
MNGNLIFGTLLLLLAMPFMLNANDGFSDCSIVGITADILDVSWQPDPLGPAGTAMQVNVSQPLNQTTTTFTKFVISYNEPSGVISNSIMREIPPSINNLADSYSVVIPDYIPAPIYTVTFMITEAGLGDVSYCVMFNRSTRSTRSG